MKPFEDVHHGVFSGQVVLGYPRKRRRVVAKPSVYKIGGRPLRAALRSFAIYEVEGSDVYRPFMRAFLRASITGPRGNRLKEILVGVHHSLPSLGHSSGSSSKLKRAYQRPGLLLTVEHAGEPYSFLFLHIKSGDTPEDFGLRDAAMTSAFNLKKARKR